MECPHGYQFGKDWEEYDECGECPTTTWDYCHEEWNIQAKKYEQSINQTNNQ